MPSTRNWGEPILPFDFKLNRTLRRINNLQNPTNLGDWINCHIQPSVDAHHYVFAENPIKDALRMELPIPRPQDFYRGNINITYFYGPLVLPLLLQGHTFMVTSSLMLMIPTRGLFSGLQSEDPHVHIAKLMLVWRSCVWRPKFGMNVIGLRVFPLSLMREAAIWFIKLPIILSIPGINWGMCF